ncbi:alpha/beta hydrolase [Avibacterium sp. 21-599]|uniref:alpha/beta hydrolase n=1 Tax=Avibacterium sp. 21-599 TaxID=2911528 RepID=UPI002247A657|nr:alpha/beta hydrolase [Avibacterium sp. 21-599]MCW9718393.1 alpha/beta hydrolase [Avibacterium sp. 21-599]
MISYKKAISAGILSLFLIGGANAMDYRQNPYGLTYENAITANIAGKVQIHPVHYKQIETGIDIAANVYTPADFNPTKKYPAIVIAHPNGGVKEQVAGLYAQRLAEQGYITIAADAAFQGQSGGSPRNVDKPFYRTNDIHAMIDFISTYQGVDSSRIAALGICGGGGYTLKAAQTDKRIAAAATISMFNTGLIRREGLAGSLRSSLPERLQKAAAAREKLIRTGEVDYEANANPSQVTDAILAQLPAGLYRDGAVYYGKTHYHPNASPRYTTESLIDLIAFDATDQIELINQPLLMIAGDKADTAYMTQDAFKQATGSQNKQLHLIKGASHIETYWKPEYVQDALNKLTEFFNKNL